MGLKGLSSIAVLTVFEIACQVTSGGIESRFQEPVKTIQIFSHQMCRRR